MPITSILCVHPNVELYGSDRMFYQSVLAFRERWPQARITVILPDKGELSDALVDLADEIKTEPIYVLRRSDFSIRLFRHLPRILARSLHARRDMSSHDIVYISTIVVLDYILATRWSTRPSFIHIHELPTGAARYAFSWLLFFSKANLIYISTAVQNSFFGVRNRTSRVIANGVPPPNSKPAAYPALLTSSPRRFRILLIGRLNRWKGQRLLVDAIARLPRSVQQQLEVRIVGGVYANQHHFRTTLIELIEHHQLDDIIQLNPFVSDPSPHYHWADLVVIPSTEPEPFGLVAIEAMAYARAVVAANHGGLIDIVRDGETGALFESGNPTALAATLLARLEDREGTVAMGNAGNARYHADYTSQAYRKRIADLLSGATGQRGPDHA